MNTLAAELYSLQGKTVFVAGHGGMVGAAIVRRLADEGCRLTIVARGELDLEREADVERWFSTHRPQVVFMAAARVGGIAANVAAPVDFLETNLRIAANVIRAAHAARVEKLLFLGSSCIYPREAEQPMREEALLSGPLEPTNEWYAVAKIAGLKLAQAYRRQHGADFISLMPTNLYGPGDNYHPEHAHAPAALIRRLHEAKTRGDAEAVVWGTGKPRREFMHVDDLADACVFAMRRYSAEAPLNVGVGEDVSIADFAALVAETVGFSGRLRFDAGRPDGAPRKLLDTSRLSALGWRARIGLREGLKAAYRDFLSNPVRES